jgi:hypothetical protein
MYIKVAENTKVNIALGYVNVGNCNNFVKRKISVLNKTKRDEILFKPKV